MKYRAIIYWPPIAFVVLEQCLLLLPPPYMLLGIVFLMISYRIGIAIVALFDLRKLYARLWPRFEMETHNNMFAFLYDLVMWILLFAILLM